MSAVLASLQRVGAQVLVADMAPQAKEGASRRLWCFFAGTLGGERRRLANPSRARGLTLDH